MSESWLMHGVRGRDVDRLILMGLTPGAKSAIGEPAGVWLTSRLETARLYGGPLRARKGMLATNGVDPRPILTPFNAKEKQRGYAVHQPLDMDDAVLVINVKGLRLIPYPNGSSNWYHPTPIGPERVVGRLSELGVEQVVPSLWRPVTAPPSLTALFK